MYQIRKAQQQDLPKILEIYAYARSFMAKTGNPNQWGTTHPAESQLRLDIQNGDLFVAEDESGIHYKRELYEKIVCSLTEKDRKIIDMKIEGYSYGEISNSIGETKQYVYRKINKLKNIIKDIIEKID